MAKSGIRAPLNWGRGGDMQSDDIEANIESSRFWAFLDRAGRGFMLWPD